MNPEFLFDLRGPLGLQVQGCFLDSPTETGIGADSPVFKELHQGFKARLSTSKVERI